MLSAILIAIAAFFAGAISAVAGFGIGSILTPLLGMTIGVKLAVAAAAIPHCIGNALRLWTLRDRVDKQVLKTFGVMSALLHAMAATHALKVVFAIVLIIVGCFGVTGWSDHLRFGRRGAWVAGGVSGLLGGLVGNQGGIRAAAMLALDVRKEVFVATAVAIALIVDGARLPVYAFSTGRELLTVWPMIAGATVAVIAGTFFGRTLLGRVPESVFRRLVAALLIALGIAMLF
jgi:uncharacterized membrane protein YfcA